jgi:hypothetical protein
MGERFYHAPSHLGSGFPVCAKPEEVAKFEKPLRLPECPLPEATK